MANKPLIDIVPGKGLDAGIFPSAEATTGAIWKTARNAWFRQLAVEHVLGRRKAFGVLGRAPRAFAQAYVNGEARLYLEDLGIVFYWNGSGNPQVIGSFSDAGSYDLEPFGTWLVATDNINQLKLWKNTGTFVDIGTGEFTRAKIIKKLAQRILAYSTDTYPTGFHWCAPSNPELWTPASGNGAGNLPMRDLDSDIVAVADLGAAHGVYTENSLRVVQYLGEALQFGSPTQALHGIGAPSKDAVVSVNRLNYGIFLGGVFVTDGFDSRLLDDPAIDKWIREEIDWDRADEIVGYFDGTLKQVIWSVPLLSGGRQGLMLNPRTDEVQAMRPFSYVDAEFSAASPREVFSSSFQSLTDGIYEVSLPNTNMGDFFLSSHLLDAGEQGRFKHWDYMLVQGTIEAGAEFRVGYADESSHDVVEWTDWQPLEYNNPFTPRESVFIAVEIKTTKNIKINGLKIFGGLGGSVM